MTDRIPMDKLMQKSIEQQQLEALVRINVQLDVIIGAAAKLWPALFGGCAEVEGELSDTIDNVKPVETALIKEDHGRRGRKHR